MYPTYTPESYNQRVQRTFKEFDQAGGEGNLRLPERTTDELATRRIGEAERMAITTLYQATDQYGHGARWPFHAFTPLVVRYLLWLTDAPTNALDWYDWIAAGAPHHTLPLDENDQPTGKPASLAYLAESGEMIDAGSIWQALADGKQAGTRPRFSDQVSARRQQFYWKTDYRLIELGRQLAAHRRSGEPEVEESASVFGGLMRETSSLAARVLEFWSRAGLDMANLSADDNAE